MTSLRSPYLKTVTRRLSEMALQRGDDAIEKPARVRSDVRVVLQALRDAEAEIATDIIPREQVGE